MLILSDNLEEGIRMGVARKLWESVSIQNLPINAENLWRAMSVASACWKAEIPDLPETGLWKVLVIIQYAEDSQFDALGRLLAENSLVPDSAACLALEGRNFHGQRNREWEAIYGNLHLSVYLKPGMPLSETAIGFTILPALAVVDMIRGQCPGSQDVGIKWVNDILIKGVKIGGVLTATQIENKRLEHVILGAGINISAAPDFIPNQFVPDAGSLSSNLPEVQWDLKECLWSLLKALQSRYKNLNDNGESALLADYRAHSHTLSRKVEIWRTTETDPGQRPPIARGTVLSIESDLSLVLSGNLDPIRHGRLVYLENPH